MADVFDRKSSQRIADATRWVEGQIPNNAGLPVNRRGPWRGALLVKTDGTHASGATQDVKIYSGDKGSETDTGETVEAHNRFSELADDTWAIALPHHTGWELAGGGGGDSCDCNPYYRFAIEGAATSGTFVLTVTATDDSGTTSTDLTFNYDDSADDIKTTLITHSRIVTEDIADLFGQLPHVDVSFAAAAALDLQIEYDSDTLSGSSVPKVSRMTPGDC